MPLFLQTVTVGSHTDSLITTRLVFPAAAAVADDDVGGVSSCVFDDTDDSDAAKATVGGSNAPLVPSPRAALVTI